MFRKKDKEVFESVLDVLREGVYVTDLKRVINYWNAGAKSITGFSSREVVGKNCFDHLLKHIDEQGQLLCHHECPLSHAIKTGEVVEKEVYLIHKRGHRVPVFIRSAPVRDGKGEIVGGCEAFHDISPRITTAMRLKELERLAMLDHLTQLANRRYVETVLRHSLEEVKRTGICVGVLLYDIDFFKSVNDIHGHHTGDQVLRMVADTLQRSTRVPDTLGRWGGEEFLEIIPNISCQVLPGITERKRILVENSELRAAAPGQSPIMVTVSVGTTVIRRDDSLESLLKRVDQLLYQSKESGRNRVSHDLDAPQ